MTAFTDDDLKRLKTIMDSPFPMIEVSICHIGWTDKDFENMWKQLAKANPPQKQDFTANNKIWKRVTSKKGGSA